MSEKTNARKQQLPVGREHIECDAPGCGKACPPKRCTRCHRGFYCNVECQRNHWRNGHREDCFDVNAVRDQVLNIGRKDYDETDECSAKCCNEKRGDDVNDDVDDDQNSCSIQPPSNTCCFICLSEPIVDPFVLPKCGHSFCFACLQKWQAFSYSKNGQPKCPACRKEAPDIVRSIQNTAVLYAARANNRDLSKDEQSYYSELALEEINKVDPNAATMDPYQKLQTLFTRAEILQQLDRPAEALESLEEVEALNEEGERNHNDMRRLLDAYKEAFDEGRIEDSDEIGRELEQKREDGINMASMGKIAFDLYLNIAQCKEATEDYTGALDIYKFKLFALVEEDYDHGTENSTPPQQREMFMRMSKCLYLIGKYELSIDLGQSAIVMNRCFPQVHKYVALSQKASGDLEAAIRTMGRAVNYETPWDEANRKIVLEMYNELKKSADSQAGE